MVDTFIDGENTPFRVHLVAASESGGAGRAASRLKKALDDHGLATRFSVQRHPSSEASRLGGYPLLGRPWWVAPAASRILSLLDRKSPGIRSLNVFPTGRLDALNQTDSDVVNLHWVGSETLSIEEIGKITKPTVWTLHDMWAFCGAKHLGDPGPNARWRSGYEAMTGQCFDIERWVWQRKKTSWGTSGWVICPSEWLSGCARDSALMGDWNIVTIPNALNTDIYAPRAKAACRARLGLPQNERLICFGAQGVNADPNKGFDLLVKILIALGKREEDQPIRCLVFGNTKDGPPSYGGIPATHLGRLTTDDMLIDTYCAADLVILPSRQENLPQVATEALSCGRPVMGFSTCGVKDVIVDGETGLLVPAFDTEHAADAVAQLLKQNERLETYGENARQRAVREWSEPVVAAQYEECFRAAKAAFECT